MIWALAARVTCQSRKEVIVNSHRLCQEGEGAYVEGRGLDYLCTSSVQPNFNSVNQ